MIFLCTNGRKKKIANSAKYLIDWDANCKSGIQKKVKNVLHDNWFTDVVFEEFPVAGTRLTFHSNSRQNFLSQLKRDEKKEYFCEINNIVLLRILESEIVEGQFPNKNFLNSI